MRLGFVVKTMDLFDGDPDFTGRPLDAQRIRAVEAILGFRLCDDHPAAKGWIARRQCWFTSFPASLADDHFAVDALLGLDGAWGMDTTVRQRVPDRGVGLSGRRPRVVLMRLDLTVECKVRHRLLWLLLSGTSPFLHGSWMGKRPRRLKWGTKRLLLDVPDATPLLITITTASTMSGRTGRATVELPGSTGDRVVHLRYSAQAEPSVTGDDRPGSIVVVADSLEASSAGQQCSSVGSVAPGAGAATPTETAGTDSGRV